MRDACMLAVRLVHPTQVPVTKVPELARLQRIAQQAIRAGGQVALPESAVPPKERSKDHKGEACHH